MKYRANLFKKNIVKELDSKSIALVEKFHHSLIEISDTEFNIELLNGEKHKYLINFSDKDTFTSTHLGQFENGNKFRLIQPIGVSLDMAKLNHNSEGGFSVGSIDPSGWAISFFLTTKNDLRQTIETEYEKSEQIEQLIQGVILAFQNGMQDEFLSIARMLLPLIEEDPMQVYIYDEGENLAYKLVANSSMFTSEEEEIIKKIELR